MCHFSVIHYECKHIEVLDGQSIALISSLIGPVVKFKRCYDGMVHAHTGCPNIMCPMPLYNPFKCDFECYDCRRERRDSWMFGGCYCRQIGCALWLDLAQHDCWKIRCVKVKRGEMRVGTLRVEEKLAKTMRERGKPAWKANTVVRNTGVKMVKILANEKEKMNKERKSDCKEPMCRGKSEGRLSMLPVRKMAETGTVRKQISGDTDSLQTTLEVPKFEKKTVENANMDQGMCKASLAEQATGRSPPISQTMFEKRMTYKNTAKRVRWLQTVIEQPVQRKGGAKMLQNMFQAPTAAGNHATLGSIVQRMADANAAILEKNKASIMVSISEVPSEDKETMAQDRAPMIVRGTVPKWKGREVEWKPDVELAVTSNDARKDSSIDLGQDSGTPSFLAAVQEFDIPAQAWLGAQKLRFTKLMKPRMMNIADKEFEETTRWINMSLRRWCKLD